MSCMVFVILSVVEVCADNGGVNVFHVCLKFGVVCGVGVCVNVCGVVCVVVCCLFLIGSALDFNFERLGVRASLRVKS